MDSYLGMVLQEPLRKVIGVPLPIILAKDLLPVKINLDAYSLEDEPIGEAIVRESPEGFFIEVYLNDTRNLQELIANSTYAIYPFWINGRAKPEITSFRFNIISLLWDTHDNIPREEIALYEELHGLNVSSEEFDKRLVPDGDVMKLARFGDGKQTIRKENTMSCDHGQEDENGIEGFDPTCSECVGRLEEERIS